jgi:sensor histidine kinase YesM
MFRKLKGISLSYKMSGIFILANLFIFVVDIALLFGINRMSVEMEMAYQNNRQLNALSIALDSLQDSTTEYLKAKSTDSLSDYYISEQNYTNLVEELGTKVTDIPYTRMERNIRNMSYDYMDQVSQTIEAKRGRNVEKYRVLYENATKRYEYIKAYIRSLNSEQFVSNSEKYTELAVSFRTFEIFAMGVMFFVLVGSALVIIRITGRLIHPLESLAASADEVANGNLEAKLPESTSSDEVGRLTIAFSKMMVSIREYIERVRESMEKERLMQEKELMMETHLKDAQLKYLQAQINPHFLFNTLNAGAQLAMMEGADRTYEYVQTVADFFRYNVKKQNELVDVADEVDIVDNYIRILNVRFSGEIHYDRQIDERLLKIKMPSMILQPIVENAVNHGIRGMGDKGHIFLKVYRDGDRVYISVKDNGKGMKPEDIEKVVNGKWKYEEQRGDSNGIGMDNVISRLRLLSEREDVIDIYSEGEDMGTEVVINIPYTLDNQKED